MLAHSDGQRDAFVRRGNMMVSQGDDAELLSVDQLRAELPFLDYDQTRFPIFAGLMDDYFNDDLHQDVEDHRDPLDPWGNSGRPPFYVDYNVDSDLPGFSSFNLLKEANHADLRLFV